MREALCDYEAHHSERFKDHVPCDMDEYIDTMLEDVDWNCEPEIVAFSEFYGVNVHVYNALTSATTYLVAKNDAFTWTIYRLLTLK